jgi:hypothetical protein
MLFRERRTEQLEPRRFRADAVPFTMRRIAGGWEAHVAPGAELATELLVDLAAHVGPAPRMRLDDLRGGGRWERDDVALGDVRDALVRLRPLLARFGGVGVSLTSDGEVAALSPFLTLQLSSRTDRWRYLLEGQGLVAADTVPDKVWRKPGHRWARIPELAEGVADLVARLSLAPQPPQAPLPPRRA